MPSHHRQIHWAMPASVFAALLAGVAFALGHHAFYTHLAGQATPSGYHAIMESQISKQQLNIAAGNAFSFLVKSMLAIAVASSYVQLFWRVMTHSKKQTLLVDVDTAFSLQQNILTLFRASTWRKQYIVLTPMALIFW
jgi:hypothetical protein